MAGEVDIGTGTSVVFGTSGFNAQIIDISGPGFERGSVETSHMGTAGPGANQVGSKTHLPVDLVNISELTLEVHLNPSLLPPIHGALETVTITFPVPAGLTNPATWVGQGFMTKYDPKVPLEGKMTATLSIQFSGPLTRTAAS